ncbi:MAG: TRAP transporter small permease subunit [Rhodospirillales bacterium]|jgi:TRAP-type C4-dicarboxylate transport system permease small subunit
MQTILKVIDRLCLGGAYAAAVLLAALFLLGFTEIVLRSGFGISLSFSVEYSGYLLVLVLFLGSGWTLLNAGHIRVTLVSEVVSDRAAHVLDVVCTTVALVVSVILSIALIQYTYGTWVRGTLSYYSSETPLAYPQALLAFGLIILTLALIARALRLLSGRPADIRSEVSDVSNSEVS